MMVSDTSWVQYVWGYFQDAREFCAQAVAAEQAMLFLVDQ